MEMKCMAGKGNFGRVTLSPKTNKYHFFSATVSKPIRDRKSHPSEAWTTMTVVDSASILYRFVAFS